MSFNKKYLLYHLVVLLVLISGVHESFASDWFVVPALTLSGEYNTNVRLAVDNQIGDIWGTTVTPRISAGRETGISQTSVNALLNFTQYSEDANLDRNEQFFDFSSRYRSSEKNIWRAKARIKRDTILRDIVIAQNQTDLVGDVEDTDVAVVQTRVKRSRSTLEPQWQHRISEKWRSDVRYKFTDVNYENVSVTQLSDYRQHAANVGVNVKYTERSSYFTSASVSDYQSQRANSDSRNYAVNVGARYSWTERLYGSLALGYRRTSQNNTGAGNDSTGSVVSGSLQKRSELGLLSLLVRRNVNPSGSGTVQNDQLRVRWRYKLSPKTNIGFRGRYFRNQSLDVSSGNRDRNYLVLYPSIEWALTRSWSVGGSYQYRRQKRDSGPGSADSHAVFMSVSYSAIKR